MPIAGTRRRFSQRESRHQDRHAEYVEESEPVAQRVDFGAQIMLHVAQLQRGLSHVLGHVRDEKSAVGKEGR